MATQLIITKDIVSKMISLLDYCYRLGVGTAREVEDEGLAREFMERTKVPGVYGLLSDSPIYITWKEWALRLMAKARSTSWGGSMKKFFDRIGYFGCNYLSAFLPISMVFYNKGIEDYLNAPAATDYALFQSKSRVWWTANGLRNADTRAWVDELQLISFDLSRRDAEVWERETAYNAKQVALTEKQYELFRRTVGLALVKHNGY